MKIILNSNKTLREIQHEFTSYFSLLKIEFYGRKHKEAEGSPRATQLDLNRRLGEFNPSLQTIDWNFTELTVVSDLEKQFHELCQVSIQVFRKTSFSWIQTISTDHWTLGEQQSEAMELIKKKDIDETPDYHEQE